MRFPFVGYALKGFFSRPFTERYPYVKREAPEGFRGKIKYDPDRCIACGMCIRVCSPGAITMTRGEKTDEGQKITMQFNLNSCTFCQMCADFCPEKAIELTGEYSMVATDKNKLVVSGSFIKKTPHRPPSNTGDAQRRKAEPTK